MDRRMLVAVALLALIGALTPFALYVALGPRAAPTAETGARGQRLLEFYPLGGETFASLKEILDFAESRLKALETARAYTAGAVPLTEATRAATAEVSKTNVQVVGVDEPDIVKAGSGVIAVARGSEVYIVGIAERKVLGKISAGSQVFGLFLEGSRLAVITSTPLIRPLVVLPGAGSPPYLGGVANTTLLVYSIEDPSSPRLLYSSSVSGYPLGARMLGGVVYILTSAPLEVKLPLVDGEPIPPGSVAKIDPSASWYLVLLCMDLSTGKHSAYAFTSAPSSWIYMSENRLYVASYPSVYEEALKEFLEAVSKRLPGGVSGRVSGLASQGLLGEALNALEDYLSSVSYDVARDILEKAAAEVPPIPDKTIFRVFAVSGLKVSYQGSVEVPGRVLDQFSMEELGGYFVVATTSGEWRVRASIAKTLITPPSSPSRNVTVEVCSGGSCREIVVPITVQPASLRAGRPIVYVGVEPAADTSNNVFSVSLEDLKVKGNLTGLAPGERVYASRLVGSTMYLVTYRQVDPLFAVDLSDPSSPRVLGYVKAPGFSEYLHPVTGKLLLGVGFTDDRRLKVSLFDVSDPKAIREASTVTIAASSPVTSDHHAFSFDPSNGRAYIPVSLWYTGSGGVMVIEVKNGRLSFVKLLEHPGALRTVYTPDEVFTVSQASINVYSSSTLEKIGEIPLD